MKFELWSLNCEVWTVKYEVWTMKSELWSVNYAVWSVNCELRSLNYELWSVNYEVWSLKCEVWSLNYEAWSLKREVWTVNWSDRVAERLALPTSDRGSLVRIPLDASFGPNLNGASLHKVFLCSPFHRPDMIEIQYCWTGCETANHPSMNCELWNGTFSCLLYIK